MKIAFNPPLAEMSRFITAALAEDVGLGDITSNLLIPADKVATMAFVAREDMVACGLWVVAETYRQLDSAVQVEMLAHEGDTVAKGGVLAVAKGPARALLTGERTALNIAQRLSGVATLTQRFVQEVAGSGAVILDTRKTMPGMRNFDKYAVRVGGAQNHRMRLDDMVLVKDNHIALCGGIEAAVKQARAGCTLPVVVECDTLAQVREAVEAAPERILLDNMSNETLREAVALVGGRVKLEASGGVSLQTVRGIAQTGVDYISVGKLTHSAVACDIGADIEMAA